MICRPRVSGRLCCPHSPFLSPRSLNCRSRGRRRAPPPARRQRDKRVCSFVTLILCCDFISAQDSFMSIDPAQALAGECQLLAPYSSSEHCPSTDNRPQSRSWPPHTQPCWDRAPRPPQGPPVSPEAPGLPRAPRPPQGLCQPLHGHPGLSRAPQPPQGPHRPASALSGWVFPTRHEAWPCPPKGPT